MKAIVLVLLLLTSSGCGQRTAVSDAGPCVAAVDVLLDRLGDLGTPDAPSGPAPSDTPFDVDACTPADRRDAADLLEEELGRQLQTFASEGTQPLGEARGLLNLIAILSAAMRPPATFAPPAGWPVTFPVHPGAQLRSDRQEPDGTLHAHWSIQAPEDPAAVVAFYEDHLQQGVAGRWDFHSAHLEQGQDGDTPSYANTYEVTGEGHQGTVHIEGPDHDGAIHVTAQLHPDG